MDVRVRKLPDEFGEVLKDAARRNFRSLESELRMRLIESALRETANRILEEKKVDSDNPITLKQPLPAAVVDFLTIFENATVEEQMAIVRALEPSR